MKKDTNFKNESSSLKYNESTVSSWWDLYALYDGIRGQILQFTAHDYCKSMNVITRTVPHLRQFGQSNRRCASRSNCLALPLSWFCSLNYFQHQRLSPFLSASWRVSTSSRLLGLEVEPRRRQDEMNWRRPSCSRSCWRTLAGYLLGTDSPLRAKEWTLLSLGGRLQHRIGVRITLWI